MYECKSRKRMGKAFAVQSGRALPMGRCASPPSPQAVVCQLRDWSFIMGKGGVIIRENCGQCWQLFYSRNYGDLIVCVKNP